MIGLRPRRRPGILLAALALILLGSLFPRGYMPVSERGRITITLCSAYANRTITLDLDGDSQPTQHSGSSNCPGIFTGLGIVPVVAPFPAPPPEWILPSAFLLRSFAIARQFHFDPNAPPQAPPVSAS